MSTITNATRVVDGVVLPTPGTWEIDPGHADVAFTGRHFMVTKVRGRFTDVTGTLTVAEDMRDSRGEVVIGMAWRGTEGVVLGDLTIHGVTREVPLEVVFQGHVRDPWGGDRAVFSAHTRINREDFGITWNMALEAGGVLVSKEISIDIEIETVLSS
jgi:polyisoprenoid-binding protein YceI